MISEEGFADWLDRQIGDADPLFPTYVRNGELVIEGNRNGLLRLVRDILGLAESNYFPYVHQHFDIGNFSLREATPMAIYRVEKSDWKGPDAGKA